MSAFAGILAGLALYFLYRCLLSGFYTVQQNERAVVTSFGRAHRLEGHSTLELPIAIGISGQLRFKVSEQNLHAFLFGVKNPVAHVMGYFISILRERIANFEAKRELEPSAAAVAEPAKVEGVSINDLRKNLNDINQQMDDECRSSSARYGIVLDASLITGIDPPAEIESALAAINTAHNEVSAQVSLAQAEADQKIEQSKRAVEIQTMRAEAEVQPLLRLAEQLVALKKSGAGVLVAYLRSVRLGLFTRARRVISEVKS